jgi:serine protease
VLNLSLGGSGTCSVAYLTAIAEVSAPPSNAVVVAAAGNSTGHAVGTPANCPGVVGVAGLRHSGAKVGFSDLGPEVTIAAPAGNCVNIDVGTPCLYPILTTSNSGTRGPVTGGSIWTDGNNISVGTSFASPIVAGAVALMLSARPSCPRPR